MIFFEESGVSFGSFPRDDFYKIEHSKGHKSLGNGFKMVEFTYLKNQKMFMVEAKSSIPNPRNTSDYENYWNEIFEKFENALPLQMMGCLKQNSIVEQELPSNHKLIDWQKAMKAHPKYKRLTQSTEAVERATRLRDEQLSLGRKQLQLLDNLTKMKLTGKQNYAEAEFATRMAERETAENARLRKLERAAIREADAQLAKDKDAVEEVYYLPDDIKIDFDDNANFYVFRQNSLYNSWPNKTIKIYSGNTAKYIVINRVGRIRIINSYEDSS